MPNEFPSDENQFDFSGVDEINESLPDLTPPQDPQDFNFSGVDKLLPKNKQPKLSRPKNPQPIASATSGGKVRSGYGVRIPPKKGASSFHQGIDIEAGAGTPVNPADEGEVIFVGNKKGNGLSVTIKHLDGRETEYNHLSKTFVENGDLVKREAVIGNVGQTGVATGPHLDFRVKDENGYYVNPFNELATDPRVDGTNLELSRKFNPDDFNFSSVDETLKRSKLKDSVEPVNPDEVDFQVGTKKVPALLDWVTSNNKPKIIANNPLEVGPVIKTNLDWSQKYKSGRTARPDVNIITDTWLRAWSPEYEQLNKKFREETGGLNLALVDQEANLVYNGKGSYTVQARTSRGVKALFEAYKKDGLAGYNATNKLINQQIDNVYAGYSEAKKTLDEQVAKRPYLNAAISGLEGEAGALTHVANNIKFLSQALLIGNIKGYDSQEYLDLINSEREQQETIGELEETIYRPPSFGGKVIAGTIGGAAALPRFALSGRLGAAGLPIMVYLENLHRGNRAAALQALPMALMAGSMHGAGEFLGSASGTSAPFRRITQKDLSLFQDTVLKGESLTINNLTPLERQLLLRGSNATLLAGSSLLTDPHQSIQDIAANLVVGLTFPVGKSPKEKFNFTILPEFGETKREPLQLGPARIDFPTEDLRPVYTQTRENPTNFLPSGEVGGNKYGERFAADIETGFRMQAEPQNVRLSLDTAALNLIDLRRSLETQSYKVEGDTFETLATKQQAIQNAISYLENAIPKDAIKFFEENEQPIRAAMKGNQQARQTKEDFVSRREEALTPDDVSPIRNPEPVFKDGKLREDVGQQNVLGTNREKTENILNNFSKITRQGSLQSSIVPYGDVIIKKIHDLGYVTAFFMEDYYHRGIEPKIDVIANRLRDALGDIGKSLTDENIKAAYKAGVDYLNSNVADPFFSRLKQDAVEKLPNKFNTEQALNILSQHKDEFEWTAGLKDFLESNKDKKISKEDLVNIIQQDQVRVEESVAEDVDPNRIKIMRDRIRTLNIEIYNISKDQSKPLSDEQRNQVTILEEEKGILQSRIANTRENLPKYSLQAYQGEKLELPGAKNSKEVKLISVFQPEKVTTTIDEYANRIYKHDAKWVRQKGYGELLDRNYQEFIKTKQAEFDLAVTKYESPHWDEPNIVAHYRSNDRVTTDNQKTYFGEEFQSDWNHDIRERGLRTQFPKGMDYEVFDPKIGTNVESKFFATREEAIKYADENNLDYTSRHDNIDRKLEPNPFMQHSWKELVMKRFIRDAVVAKDENGNYKYDGVGWTTARQQAERYGKILEGKDFTWKKNSDGTYSFIMGDSHAPHELQNISLERFAELTTKEAAQEVRDQETKFNPYGERTEGSYSPHGQFNLKEAVTLRSGLGTYQDYDVALVNIAKKIGKRFGAKYHEKNITTNPILDTYHYKTANEAIADFRQGKEIWMTITSGIFKSAGEKLKSETEIISAFEVDSPVFVSDKQITKIEPVHFLEITPSMRQSLEREGLPLYGLGRSEKLNNPETGIRNRVTTREAFDQHRDSLVKSIEDYALGSRDRRAEEIKELETRINEARSVDDLEAMRIEIENRRERLSNTFNSGLNPDALVDQFKLLYSGVKDFQDFSSKAIKRFGEEIKPFLHDLWIQVQGIADTVSSSFDDLADYLQNGKNSPIFKSRQFKEGGFMGIGTKASQALKDYQESKQREGVFRVIPPKLWRGIGLAQASVEFGKVYAVTRSGQRARNAFESSVLNSLKKANDFTKNSDPHAVGEIIFQGNEQSKVFSDTELATKGLNTDQINAYKEIRRAEDLNLEWRKQHTLYNMRERADQLNDRLLAATPGTPAHDAIITQLLDLGKAMTDVEVHYEQLKNSGYISLQRQGKIVALANDATGLLYQHFDSTKEANKWVLDQEASGATGAKIYDFRLPENLREASARLTPGQFEDLLDAAGVNPNSKEIEQLRDEVYSRYPSYGYQLKRDFTRGYDRNWKFVLDSVARQTEIYANSFYSRVAGNEAMKKLSQLDLYSKNPEMYEIAKRFIDDEISAPDRSTTAALGGGIRKAVYLLNLGFDINQLYLNAVAQPITQTYSYFARIEHNGIKLGRAGAEKYFIEAGGLINKLAAKKLGANVNVDPLFEQIYSRLQAEKVIEPEFNKSLLEIESQKSVQSQLSKKIDIFNWQKFEHWASVFMRAGEKTTRAHAAAEAFLVGKEKFNLSGEELVDFMVRAVDATQSNPSRGEAPFYVRKFGETGKLFYQFNAFNHMWLENLALNVRSDFKNRGVKATAKHLAPLVVMGGIRGLPLSGFALGLYTLISGDDIKKKYLDRWFKNHENLERLALYGITTSPAISQKITPSVPILDTLRTGDTIKDTVLTNLESSTIPALSTASQILQGFDDLLSKDQKLRGLAEISPRVGRGPLVVARTSGAVFDEEVVKGEGYRTRGGSVILRKKKITTADKVQQFFNITPIEVSEYYEEKKSEKLQEIHNRIRKRLKRL